MQVGTKFSERLQSITNDLPVTCTEQIKEVSNLCFSSEHVFLVHTLMEL